MGAYLHFRFTCRECGAADEGYGHPKQRRFCQDCRHAHDVAHSKRQQRERPFSAKGSEYVYRAIRKGILSHPSNFGCMDCGKQATTYDHRFYSEPLLVQPVCRSCNKRRGPAWDSEILKADVAHGTEVVAA